MREPQTKKILILIIFLAVIGAGIGIAKRAKEFEIFNNTSADASPAKTAISTDCPEPNPRPIAVMISSDKEARPLSGIGQADMVFEMPVTDNGITRMMAVFTCHQPKEIGSIRSSRLDFIPLAQGLGAVYAHWGGEHQALQQLNSGVIDNIDGLIYDGTTYFRKRTIYAPHNGFTSFELLTATIGQRHYSTETNASGYQYTATDKSFGLIGPSTSYAGMLEVTWTYDPKTNDYARTRGNEPEIDHNSQSQVHAKNIVIMKTTWSPISKDYIRVQTLGGGEADIYQNGTEIIGTWKKTQATDKLIFSDKQGKEIPFVPGPVWIEITTS